jgi:transposase
MEMNLQGAQVNDSWLVDCVRGAAEHYRSIALAIRDQVLANRFLQADETPIRQQTDTGIKTAYFWVWLGGGQVHFHFGHGRSQDEVSKVLGMTDEGPWERGALIGYLVCDGYAGYNLVFASGKVKRVACWSHARRKFHSWRKMNRNAATLTALIDDLFRNERLLSIEVNEKRLDATAGYALRAQRRCAESRPFIAAIKAAIERLLPLYTPKTRMHDALSYALNKDFSVEGYEESR